MPQSNSQVILADSPFDLSNDGAYQTWRSAKLKHQNPVLSDLLVPIKDPYALTEGELGLIRQCCADYNMAIYQLADSQQQDKSLVHALGKQLGMQNLDANLRSDEDSVSSLQVSEQVGTQYIPYTSKALSWHTDGYYNLLEKQIYGIIMHCVRPAASGGINTLLNPESVYIALRDEDPAYIEALMHPEAMTIPENVENGKVIRATQSGPVFMIKSNGRLHMRYSARKRNIMWRATQETAKAVELITAQLANEQKVLKVGLQAGQGIICNNVLHNRSSFNDSDSEKRLMYRARYYDAVT